MEEKLRQVVATIAETSPTFSANANLRDELNVDSVRVFELIFEIEKTFRVTMPEEGLRGVMTFNELLAVVTALQTKASTTGASTANAST